MPRQHTSTGSGNAENLNPQFPDLAKALKGIDLPQDKEGLYDHADENGADDIILEMIDDMPDQEYETMADIMAAFRSNSEEEWESHKSPDDFDEE